MKNTMCDILAYQGRVAGSLILFWLRLHVNLFGCMFVFGVFQYQCWFFVTDQLILILILTIGPRGAWAREKGAV